MADKSVYADKTALIEKKIQQINKILMEEDITFGVAKTIIKAVEAAFLEVGDTFLKKSALKNVLPSRA